MPELPDLQVFSVNLQKKLSGKAVKKLTVHVTKKLKIPKSRLKKSVEGQVLREVSRVGKELHFKFTNDIVLGLHLMLHGQLFLFEGKNAQKNTIIELVFDDNTGLALVDFQKQATPTLNPESRDTVDALSDALNFRFLKVQLSNSKATIKNLLLDQQIIRGIGNAYADEILWSARISPFSISNQIPEAEIKKLARSIKTVLHKAEKQIVKQHPDIISGEVRDFLDIHNSKKTHSPTGVAIQHKVVNSRKTYFTDEQKLFP